MNASEILRIVDAIHRDKNIEKELVFEGIEQAFVAALKKHYGEEAEVDVSIDQESGELTAACEGETLDSEEVVGRIGAQTAKQVMIQKIREAERDALYDEYEELIGHMISGVIQRYEGAAATVSLGNVEAILPRSEQIPGETHHANERVRATVYEVRKAGSRVKVILSRRAPALVQRLFEQEIPEIADSVIEIRAMAREPGYRSKVAVSSNDTRVDCVGACVGVRGNRIKNIVDELAGERIDIVRWDDDLEVLIPNALQPAEVEQVILCKMLGRAIVLVQRRQPLAGDWATRSERPPGEQALGLGHRDHDSGRARRVDRPGGGRDSARLTGIEFELAEKLVEEGFLSYDDLSIIEPDDLMEMGKPDRAAESSTVIEQAETRAEEAEKPRQPRPVKQKKEQEKLADRPTRLRPTAQPAEAAAAEPTEAAAAEPTEAAAAEPTEAASC